MDFFGTDNSKSFAHTRIIKSFLTYVCASDCSQCRLLMEDEYYESKYVLKQVRTCCFVANHFTRSCTTPRRTALKNSEVNWEYESRIAYYINPLAPEFSLKF
jgi:hypothetical protein